MTQKVQILVPCKVVAQTPEARKSVGKALAQLIPTQSNFSIGEQPDLLFMRSLLVSTGANKNDDVFLPDEMWKARSTPILKPVDWEHHTGRELTLAEMQQNPQKVIDGSQTIGVMYNAYAIDENGIKIDESKALADDFVIPSEFHIIDDAVIWKALYPTVAARIEKGAAEGTLFVSMEAWFTDYHYLMGDKIIARNEETAFLDSSLRANGGNGVYGSSRVRRALRNLTFGGKGIVARPANDPSIITHVSHEPLIATASLDKSLAKNIIGEIRDNKVQAYELRGEKVMSDKKIQEVPLELLTEAKEENATLKAEASQKEADLAAANQKIAELEKQIADINSAFTKGAQILEAQAPGISSRVAEDSENFFSIVAECLEETTKAKADVDKKLEEALANIAKVELDARTAARSVKIDALLTATMHEGMSDDDKKKAEEKKAKKKEKMMAAVKDLNDESFDALYEVWAEQQAEANEMNRGAAPLESGSDMNRGASKGQPTHAGDITEAIKEALARMVANPNKGTTQLGGSGGGDAANPNKGTTQMGSGASITDAIAKAIAGHQEPNDEENFMAILDGVTSSERAPAAGEEEQQGFDLRPAFGGLVNKMLRRSEDK